MLERLNEFQQCIQKGSLTVMNNKLNTVVQDYFFQNIGEEFSNNNNNNKDIFQRMVNSKEIIINHSKKFDSKAGNQYLIIGFEKTIIIIQSNLLSYLHTLFSSQSGLTICFLSNSKEIFDQNIQIKYDELPLNMNFKNEVINFNHELILQKVNDLPICEIWTCLIPCISGYLILKSYHKLHCNRIQNLINYNIQKRDFKVFNGNEYIKLGYVGTGSLFAVELIYMIEKEEIMILKQPNIVDNEIPKLMKREIENYKEICHPFLPQFYGTVMNNNGLIIEYIKGKTLTKITDLNLNDNEKFTIIFEVMLIFLFLHHKNCIYRDLKPDNIMIDHSKNVVLIDFDRMLCSDDFLSNQQFTNIFDTNFMAPEINSGIFSRKCDIFSIGQVMYYLIKEKEADINKSESNQIEKYNELNEIYKKCTKLDDKERPSIDELIIEFYINYHSRIQIKNIFEQCNKYFQYFLNDKIISVMKMVESQPDDPHTNIEIGLLYFQGQYVSKDDIKGNHYFFLAEKSNRPDILYKLGYIYDNGIDIACDPNKAIYYYSLASELNYQDAQYALGRMYYIGNLIQQDVNKALNYFVMAAEHNQSDSLFYLGIIYYGGKYVKRDVNKCIEYLMRASDLNHSEAQMTLGCIYSNYNDDKLDIQKAIHYFTLAANQKNINSHVYLGIIYYEGKHIDQNISKAIDYFSFGAEKQNPEALYYLGLIYLKGKDVSSDINKGISFLSKAASLNNEKAQMKLGSIYYKRNDINTSIHYYLQAANNNNPNAQFIVGITYLLDDFKDVNKAIHFLSLAAKQDHVKAQYFLGKLCLKMNNIDMGIKCLELAATANDIEACNLLGVTLLTEKKDVDSAILFLTIGALQDNVISQIILGIIYYNDVYIPRDIELAIHYLQLAANQNHPFAQYQLSKIYHEGKYVQQDLKKSDFYSNCALNNEKVLNLLHLYDNLNKNDVNELLHNVNETGQQQKELYYFYLGLVYFNGEGVQRDIEKSIYYLKLSSDLNCAYAQHFLGELYYDCSYVPHDIPRSIHYLSLAAEKKLPDSCHLLGIIYLDKRYNYFNVQKAIDYLTQAANFNDRKAQFKMGLLYYNRKFVPFDITKSIHYFKLAANQYEANALLYLGYIYYKGEYVTRDIEQAIKYLTLASKQNDLTAQRLLGNIYYRGNYIQRDMKKSIYYFKEASKNNDSISSFIIGYLYHEGKYINRDIKEAIHYYKKASNVNDYFAKNNLGIIYKNGFRDEVPQNLSLAIEYFNESIKITNDGLASYNLAHLYFYNDFIQNSFKKTIELLIESAEKKFSPSKKLLSLILIKTFGANLDIIQNELKKYTKITNELSLSICQHIKSYRLTNNEIFMDRYELYKTIDFLYTYGKIKISHQILNNEYKNLASSKLQDITELFYEGFGYDLL